MSDTESKLFGQSSLSKIGRPCTSQQKPTAASSLIRSSLNTSVVLTENTDAFIIGNRVWVGGTKPGSIAYIGETQFAPGDWAGIVLDQPIGKNDGSVAGLRYFQCTPRHGIFSRLTRLTRQPLSNIIGSMSSNKKTFSNVDTTSLSLNTSTTSLSSSVSQYRDLKIGDRVIVSSNQGSKTGILRYLGATEFAVGEWCGVELNDPVGKNDGSVAEIRYFKCPLKHGLFAPVKKVSRSPLSKRSSLFVVRKPTSNPSIRKTNSRESLTSETSIVSSTSSLVRGTLTSRKERPSTFVHSSLQKILFEKQQEIDMLKRERDSERKRMTKAAIQAGVFEQSEIALNQEYCQYRENMEKTVLEAQSALAKLLEETKILNVELDNERKKSEDLLFRFEEESINREDTQIDNTVWENKIEKLEEQLNQERVRIIQLEHDNTKLFELEGESQALCNENKNLQGLVETKFKLDSQLSKLNHVNEELQRVADEKLQIQETLEKQIILLKRIDNENNDLFAVMNSEIVKLKEIIVKLENENAEEKMFIVTESKQTIHRMDEEIKSKIDKINHLKSILEEVNQPLAIQKTQEKTETIGHLYNQLETQNALNSKLQSEMELKKRQFEEEKNMIIAKEEKWQKIRENLEKLNSQLEIEKTELKEIINAKDLIINDFKKSVGINLDSKLVGVAETSMKCRVMNKDEEMNNLLKKTTELRDTIIFSGQTKKNLESELKIYETNMKGLNKNLAISHDNIKELKAEKIKLKNELCSVLSPSAYLLENSREYNEDLRSKNEEIVQLKKRMLQADISNKSAQQQLNEKNDIIEFCNKQIDNLKLEVSFFKESYEQLTNNLSAADNKFTESTSKFDETVKSYQCHITQLELQIKSFQNDLRSRQLNTRYPLKMNNISQLNANSEGVLENLTNDKEASLAENASIISQSQKGIKACKHKISEKDIDNLENSDLTPAELLDLASERKNSNNIVKNAEKLDKHFQIDDIQNRTAILLPNEIIFEQQKFQEIKNIFDNSTLEKQSATNSGLIKQSKIGENEILLTETREEIDSVQSEYQNLHKYNGKLEYHILVRDSTIKKLTNQLEASKNKNTNLSMEKIQCENEIDLKKSNNKLQKYMNKMEDMQQQINALHTNQFQLKEVESELQQSLYQYDEKTSQVTSEHHFEKKLDDNETYKSQIEFLNSVIVDVQKKNEKLLCKIKVLEMGVLATESDDCSRSTLNERADVPRLFCDICDRFDLHDTEKCPMQSEDQMSDEASIKLKMPKATPERPYCESCEMFGHDTTDCDNIETY